MAFETASKAMRSIRMQGKGVIEVVEEADPVPGLDEVVVETAFSAICGSELHG